jgi:hypothetical protein
VNYRNLAMSELASILQLETDPKRFIEAAKVFITKFIEDGYVSRDELEDKANDAHNASFEEGYDQCKQEWEDEGTFQQGYDKAMEDEGTFQQGYDKAMEDVNR